MGSRAMQRAWRGRQGARIHHWVWRRLYRAAPKMIRAAGGSPMLQQDELDFRPAEKSSIFKEGF